MTALEKEAVREQLDRILASPEFMSGDKLGQFLEFVVTQTLDRKPERIKQYTIAVDALGYGEDFDPSDNPTVRIVAGRVRRALDRYYANQGSQDPLRISVPKGTYIPAFDARETDADDQNCTGVLDDVVASSPMVAVLAFEAPEAQGEVLAVGLTSEIAVGLTRFAELSVLGPIAPTNGEQMDIRELRRRHGASFALMGWVRHQNSTIRITTDLLDTREGTSVWGKTFEFDLARNSLFDIEDQVTNQLCGVIGDGLGVVFRRMHSESYREHIKLSDVSRAILLYNYGWSVHTLQSWQDAYDATGEALRQQPNNALLLALLANICYGDVLHGMGIAADSATKMVELADRAVSLDPNLQVAQYNQVVLHAFHGRVEPCVEQARRVVAMNPHHARVLGGCAIATTSVGAYELGCELLDQAKRLNPQYPGVYCFVDYVINYREQRFDDAWANAKQIETPGIIWQPLLRAAVLGKLGRAKQAQPFLEKLIALKPDFVERPHEYIQRLLATDEHVEMIVDGLTEAGLGLEQQSGAMRRVC